MGRVGNRKKGKIAARENFQKNILAAADLSTVRQKFFLRQCTGVHVIALPVLNSEFCRHSCVHIPERGDREGQAEERRGDA